MMILLSPLAKFSKSRNDQDGDVLNQDGSGDRWDAFLCAVQAGWAYTQYEQNYGIPVDCDPREGWIVDPLLASKTVGSL